MRKTTSNSGYKIPQACQLANPNYPPTRFNEKGRIRLKEEQSFFIREINERDQDFLFEMLYQSIFVKPGSSPPDRDILSLPEIRKYVEKWGRENDFGFIAIDNESKLKIGAIWLRYFDFKNKGYGYISDNIPEIGIAVDCKRRR